MAFRTNLATAIPKKVITEILRVAPDPGRWSNNKFVEILGSPHYSSLFNSEKLGCTKWQNYSIIYDQLLSEYRNLPGLRILEIGVLQGGSQRILKSYFKKGTIIYGVDISRDAEQYITGTQIRIGDATDSKFLEKIIHEMGGVDIVIDDGSHLSSHQKKSFEILFPYLNQNGLYIIEDLEHSYFWKSKSLPYLPNTFWNFAKRTTEYLNVDFRKYKKRFGLQIDPYDLFSISFFPQIIAFRKLKRLPPKIVNTSGYSSDLHQR